MICVQFAFFRTPNQQLIFAQSLLYPKMIDGVGDVAKAFVWLILHNIRGMGSGVLNAIIVNVQQLFLMFLIGWFRQPLDTTYTRTGLRVTGEKVRRVSVHGVKVRDICSAIPDWREPSNIFCLI